MSSNSARAVDQEGRNRERRSARRSRLTTGSAVLATLALLLSGCSLSPEPPAASAEQLAAFPTYYEQTIAWQECDDDFGLDAKQAAALASWDVPVDTFRCGMVSAPLDWNAPENAESIELAVLHVPATGSEPIGTLLGNPGGPGSSGLEYTFNMTATPGFDAIMERYDLLGFDPRGIGRSTPVACDDVFGVFEVQLASCVQDNPLAHSMGTSQVARDMELLRSLMNDDALHYLGYSYGTMLGATYSTLFPEKVGRMVLDSAASAQWASLIGGYDQSRAIAMSIAQMLADCGVRYAVDSCPLTTEGDMLSMIGQLAMDPLIASDGTEVDGTMVHGYLTASLYSGALGRTMALNTIAAAVAEDQAAIDFLADEMSGGGASVGLAGTIVRCHSFARDPDIMGLVEHITEVGVPELLGGPDLTDDTLQEMANLSCFALPEAGDDITDSFSGSKDAPILVIGITGDHATPYSGAAQLTKQLGNARLLTLNGDGHGASFSARSSCADDAATAYLLEGTLPAEGMICTDD